MLHLQPCEIPQYGAFCITEQLMTSLFFRDIEVLIEIPKVGEENFLWKHIRDDDIDREVWVLGLHLIISNTRKAYEKLNYGKEDYGDEGHAGLGDVP